MDNRQGVWRMMGDERRFFEEESTGAARYQCIVVGGGTAGAMAAIALVQRGVKTLVVERMNCLGGTGTAGHVAGYYFGSRGGLYEQIDAAAEPYEAYGYAMKSPVNVELKKRVLEEAVAEGGGTIAFDADLTGVIMAGRRVLGVEYADDAGLHRACADVVIDASAEGYVCLLAGAEYTLGRDLDHKPQPFSCMRITSLDNQTASGAYIDCGYARGTDPEEYTRAVLSYLNYSFYDKQDFAEGGRFLGFSQQVGIREGPLFIGDERVRLADVADGENRPDRVLFYAYSNADNHGKDMAFENQTQQDWMIACSLWGLNFTVAVPVGCVMPKGIDNLLMAGRMISVDHDLASCVRQKRDIQKCGEAVGVLAALAIQSRVSPREVDYGVLSRELRKSGCLLPQNNFGFVNRKYPLQSGRVVFPTDLGEIRRQLAGDAPGVAMWRGRRHEPLSDFYPWLKDENRTLTVHTAMMLALAGDDAGADILLDAIRRRDSYVPMTGLKFNMIRGVACLYLIGRLACRRALPDVLAVISGWETIVPEQFVPDEFLYDEEEYRFQYLSMAVWAADRIAAAHPETRGEVNAVIDSVIGRADFSIHSALKGPVQQKYEMAGMIRQAHRLMQAL